MPKNLALQAFIDRYPPGDGLVRADESLLQRYRGLLPECLLELWAEHGFGRYGGGLIEIVNPDDFKAMLYQWLMYDEEDPSRLPVALSAFGEIFYYRKLTEVDEDISCLDPHLSSGSVCTWSLKGFFNADLADAEFADPLLQRALFERSVAKLGPPGAGEIFYFVPALRLGGARDVAFVDKGNALVHLELLYQFAVS